MVSKRSWMVAVGWLVANGMALVGCEPRQPAHLPGTVSFDYVGYAGTDFEARLENGSSKEIGFRGQSAGPGAAYAWDSEIRCDSPAHDVVSVHGPMMTAGGGVDTVRVLPGEKVRVIYRKAFALGEGGSHCHLRLRLADGTNMEATGEFDVTETHEPVVDKRRSCEAMRDAFIKDPERIAAALHVQPDCWPAMAGSDDAFDALMNEVSKGNLAAAKYLAPHQSELDGANAEDASIALGEFSEHHMTEFLDLARTGVLDTRHMTDAVSMLSPDIGDDYQEQLTKLGNRRLAAEGVSDPTLDEYRKAVIGAIDDEIKETKRGMKLSKETQKTQ
jgi:hypothetical protein